ncbi:MAG: copper amine oxidase N-terminal domain-containing protein [Clostridiales bacterium]|jgi:hypothetical protein|nr:copper amine oxidase N-terminal domain-containing protein [Clostridiales bacterium]
MKKLIILILAAVTLLAIAVPAWAAGDIKIVIDGKELVFGKGEQGPIMENGRVLVPLRRLFEEIECQVHYLPEGQRIHIYSFPMAISINMRVGSPDAFIYSKAVALDVAPKVVNGVTLIPLRFAAENSRSKVVWDASKRQVNITTQPLLHVNEYAQQKFPLKYCDGMLIFANPNAGGAYKMYGTAQWDALIMFDYLVKDNNTISLLLDPEICRKVMPELQHTLIQAADYYQAAVSLQIKFSGFYSDSQNEMEKLEQTKTNFETFTGTDGSYNFIFLHMQYSPYTKNFHSQWYYQSELTVEIIK